MNLAEIILLIVCVPTIIFLAVMVDRRDHTEDFDEKSEVKPLLGVVAPKKDKKEEK